MKIFYESHEDWKAKADYLRCSPQFHGTKRHDHVLVHGEKVDFFAKLILIFSVEFEEREYPLALIQPLDRPTGTLRRKDRLLELFRVGAQPRDRPELISIHSIIRGAFIIPDFENTDDCFVVDTIDGDMFLRIRKYWAATRQEPRIHVFT